MINPSDSLGQAFPRALAMYAYSLGVRMQKDPMDPSNLELQDVLIQCTEALAAWDGATPGRRAMARLYPLIESHEVGYTLIAQVVEQRMQHQKNKP